MKAFRYATTLFIGLVILVFLVLGCTTEQTSYNNDKLVQEQTKSRVIPIESIEIPKDQLKNQGQVEQAWRVNEDIVLLEQVWHQDYDYYLLDNQTGHMEWIVPFIENARLDTIADKTIQFIAKGGGDCGDFEFPYRLIFNLDEKNLTREALFLQRGVVFGTITWEQALTKIEPGEAKVKLVFKVKEGQVLAGGLRRPLSVVNYEDDKLVVRIYNVTGESFEQVVDNSSLIEKVTCVALSQDTAIDNLDLLKEDFPYGGGQKDRFNLQYPSVRLEIVLNEKAAYQIKKTLSENSGDPGQTYEIIFRPILPAS